ncbi:MAG: YlbF family regulator [bacterium]|nr:YlbF family regulator [bacterium]
MNNIYYKLNDIINSINNIDEIKRMKSLKKEIYADKNLKEDLNAFHNIMENPYSNEYVELKRKILENDKVKEYKKLENKLFITVLEINKRLNTLIDKRKCLL